MEWQLETGKIMQGGEDIFLPYMHAAKWYGTLINTPMIAR